MLTTLSEIESAVRAAWGPDTTYARPEYLEGPVPPSRGQCGPTALLVQDLLGGDLVMADLATADGGPGVHYWNRFGDLDVDLTRDQLQPGETLSNERLVARRRPEPGSKAGVAYATLRERVLAALSQSPERLNPGVALP